jgi:hypothetical protein
MSKKNKSEQTTSEVMDEQVSNEEFNELKVQNESFKLRLPNTSMDGSDHKLNFRITKNASSVKRHRCMKMRLAAW